jgi:dipeptidase E
MTMKQIIAIGGSTNDEILVQRRPLERYILAQTKKEHPKICFLQQASAEDKEYLIKLYDIFLALGAQPTSVSLFGRVKKSIEQTLLSSDIIYVGGGNTRSMIALWKEWGIDTILLKAYEQGTLLAGASAGAICWFEACITDSVPPLCVLPGLGFLKGSCCPHYDSEKERRPAFQKYLKLNQIMPGIALEDNVAAHFIDGSLHQIVTAKSTNNAYYVSAEKEDVLKAVYLLADR